MNIPENTLILVASGAEAIFYRASGEGSSLSLRVADDQEPVNLADEGPSGSFVPEASDADIDEATFAKQLASDLYDRAHAGKFDHLVLIADPRTLGQMRPQLHQEVENRIILELAKTLTNLPIKDIEKQLVDA